MTTPTHPGPGAAPSSYDGRGPLTGSPTAPSGSFRVVADVRRVAELPAQRGLVPELRRELPAAPRPPARPTARHTGGHHFNRADAPYVGVHQPNEQARRCRTCPMSTTWPHGYCSQCTKLDEDPGCGGCRPTPPPLVAAGRSLPAPLPGRTRTTHWSTSREHSWFTTRRSC